MGFFEDVATYVWNWAVWGKAFGQLTACYVFGGFDLFWSDDDGTYIERCIEMVGGSKVTFPVEYVFAGAPEGGV